MNAPSDFDHRMRQCHAASLQALSPQTLARLRDARHGAGRARRPRGYAWLGASALAAVLAVAAAARLMPPSSPAVSSSATHQVLAVQATLPSDANDAYVSTADVLDQNPDLYVWLGASDTKME
ncbi:hypothetical protein [Pseudoxanthomonas winnipegensis]|uniref:Uncharacterized protein n=1 Tax=Pseudoxanthomonas winnipegensis TaxID=2480810 RepID=A0A4Q8LUM8_9GAMM|nr:hypothetical protein [Pseudoxanthomonas winnipegensis]RZZ85470.1 hypothetical protein EA663_10610 [Pseudoxanthomonas winnipegensis]TAA35716.1 hypothetical protein EA656_08540 [Pseudoxanthomonas winnipegensis]TAA45460.1 hypothetical protein EA655_04505 [Pseudoxanthomonas winnipegensis]